ncbi:MAG: hypothetical protein PHU63_02065, partial [Candidatus ainarchaeum sp.]|nr:hypothetical protein [Candidatus ainarchaeum sp.]
VTLELSNGQTFSIRAYDSSVLGPGDFVKKSGTIYLGLPTQKQITSRLEEELRKLGVSEDAIQEALSQVKFS